MTSSATTAPAAAPATDRVRLARTALAAAVAHPAVVAAHPGRRSRTVSGSPDGLVGVEAVAEPGGRYGLELHLVVRPVPLHALADDLRARVRAAAARMRLAEQLGSIAVGFEDVQDGEAA